jgi:hypothetical protein
LLDLTKQSGVPLSDIDNSLRLAAETWTRDANQISVKLRDRDSKKPGATAGLLILQTTSYRQRRN